MAQASGHHQLIQKISSVSILCKWRSKWITKYDTHSALYGLNDRKDDKNDINTQTANGICIVIYSVYKVEPDDNKHYPSLYNVYTTKTVISSCPESRFLCCPILHNMKRRRNYDTNSLEVWSKTEEQHSIHWECTKTNAQILINLLLSCYANEANFNWPIFHSPKNTYKVFLLYLEQPKKTVCLIVHTSKRLHKKAVAKHVRPSEGDYTFPSSNHVPVRS